MKLIMACVAALSLFGCAEDPTSTSGDNEVNVVGTKVRTEDIRYSEQSNWADVKGGFIIVHDSDGRIDDAQIFDPDAKLVCHVRQTATRVLESTCL